MRSIKSDVVFVLGLACFGYGLWQVYQPLAPILIGLILIWMAGIFSRQR